MYKLLFQFFCLFIFVYIIQSNITHALQFIYVAYGKVSLIEINISYLWTVLIINLL